MSHNGFPMPSSGLASRRGDRHIKPLSMDVLKSPNESLDNGVPTPRTSRGHLLAGLRTAPKTATASTFSNNGPASPVTGMPNQMRGGRNMYDSNSNMFNGPRTSVPRFSNGQAQAYNPMMAYQQHYTPDQVLAPPELHIDEQVQEQIDPSIQAYYMTANAYLAEQQRRLQAELLTLQAAAQQMSLNGQYQMMQQQQQQQQQRSYSPKAYQQQQQQQQVKNMQPMMTAGMVQPNIYAFTDPVTGQQTLYVDQNQAQQFQAQQLQAQLNIQTANQNQYNHGYAPLQQNPVATPRVQVSPPPLETNKNSFRNPSPPRCFESPIENPTPLPPPSANAFRRGHKKSTSVANALNKANLSITTEESLKSAGANVPKSATVPLTPLTATGSYGPGQARAGEHPCRQPRNPPSMDELKAKPTAKHEGSKNFVTRTRRHAINNLSAGRERRKEARGSGSITPISELNEEPEMVSTPTSDTGSESGRSGSGSLVVDYNTECSLPSSRTSTGSWGAIGSDRPSSSQKITRDSVDSTNSSDAEADKENNSFASVFKKANRAARAETVEGQRKAAMLVLTSGEKRKLAA